LEKSKVSEVIYKFFASLKAKEDYTLETGLSQHATIDLLQQAVITTVDSNPEKFEVYVKFFLNGAMYLLEEDDDLLDIEEMLNQAQ
jgi:hypothetical protein